MYCLTSGNETVDMMRTVNLTGNVIPHIWYKQIVRENGKPYHLAISLLADIVYWYRPVEIRDEATGNIVGLQKRFKHDMLQKTYDQYAEFYGESDRSVRAALKHLEDMGLILRVFRTITLSNDMKLPNVMYIALNAEKVIEITHPKKDGIAENEGGILQNSVTPEVTFGHNVQKSEGGTNAPELTSIPESPENKDFSGGGTKECRVCDKIMQGVVQNFVTPPTKECNIPPQKNAPHMAADCHTNTDNTTETTPETTEKNEKESNPIYQSTDVTGSVERIFDGWNDGNESGIDMLYSPEERRQMVYENTDYFWHMMNDDEDRRKAYKDLVDIVCDVVCGKYRGEISVGGAMMPVAQVKARMLEINGFHIEYVRDCLEKLDNHSGIKNIRSYMLTCLYNAPVTMDQYIAQMVHHDRSMGKHFVKDSTFGHDVQKLKESHEIT